MKAKDLITLRETLYKAYVVALDQLDSDMLIYADKQHWMVQASRSSVSNILKSIRIIGKL
jgi:hypothetical protein